MQGDEPRTRPLTGIEGREVEIHWIRRIRRNLWLAFGSAIVCAAIAFGSGNWEMRVPFLIIAAVLGLIGLNSLWSLSLVTRDLVAGTVEENLGSVRKEEGFRLEAVSPLLGFAIRLATTFARSLFCRATLTRGNPFLAASMGFPLVLVRPHSTDILCVDRDTYQSFGDGALVKAVVLPRSRLALKVGRASLGDGGSGR